MSLQFNHSFRQSAQNALQEAAAFFRLNQTDKAYHVLHEQIFTPHNQGLLTQAQADAVYRSIIPDPLSSPVTPFSQRSCIPAVALRGKALQDLVFHYALQDCAERSAILKAAEILETTGDEEKAWKVLHEALKPTREISEDLVKEVHRIMFDSLRIPTSPFLQKHVKEHPAILEDHLLRAETLECLSSHFFDKEVVEGSPIKLDSPVLEFRAKTRSALQQAAQLLRYKEEEAYELLKDAIWLPYERGELTKAQVGIIYKTLEDPHDPQTEFARRLFLPLLELKGHALLDLLKFYSECPSDNFYYTSPLLTDPKAKKIIEKAAHLLISKGDFEAAWKILNDGLPSILRNTPRYLDQKVVKEIHQLMNDSFRTPLSSFLKNRIKENPSLIDDNRLRARALENLSQHIFDSDIVRGNVSSLSAHPLPPRMFHEVLSFVSSKDLVTTTAAAKPMLQTIKDSIKSRREASWQELEDLKRIGITLDKDLLSSLRVIRGAGGSSVDSEKFETILSLCPKLEVLELGSKLKKKLNLSLIGKYCPHLLSLSITDFQRTMGRSELEELAKGCTKLQDLRLNCLIAAAGLPFFSQYCPNLRNVDIDGAVVEHYDIPSMVAFVQGCKNLIRFTALQCAINDDLLKALAKCSSLTTLKLSNVSIHSRITAAGLEHLVSGCRDLEDLELIHLNLGDNEMRTIGQARLPRLTRLTIQHNGFDNRNVTSEGYIALFEGCGNVRDMDLSSGKLDDDSIEAIGENCPLLISLDISGAMISPQVLPPLLKKCPHLTNLKIRCMSILQKNYLQAVTESRTPCRITSLDYPFSPATVQEALAFVQKNPGLESIALPDDVMTDEVLIAIAQNCPKLKSVRLGLKVTAKGVGALGKGCPLLTHITATHLRDADDNLLSAIGENFPELSYLKLSFSRGQNNMALFGKMGFVALGKGCPKLSELYVDSCNLSEGHIKTISSAFRQLKVLDFRGFETYPEVVKTILRRFPGIKIQYTENNSDHTVL